MDDGCAIVDTITTVCVSTPPLPATGVPVVDMLATAIASFVLGFTLAYLAGRREPRRDEPPKGAST